MAGKPLDQNQVLEATAKGLGKWCLFLSIPVSNVDEALVAAPCLGDLDPIDQSDFILDGGGTLVFDSEDEAREAYGSTVGEDGPTKTNPYRGPAVRVYACLCGPDGKTRTENS